MSGNKAHQASVSDERHDSRHEQAGMTQRQQELQKETCYLSSILPDPLSHM